MIVDTTRQGGEMPTKTSILVVSIKNPGGKVSCKHNLSETQKRRSSYRSYYHRDGNGLYRMLSKLGCLVCHKISEVRFSKDDEVRASLTIMKYSTVKTDVFARKYHVPLFLVW